MTTSKHNTTEGDVAHQANVARRDYRVDGTGIGIGVLSDGIDTLAARQAAGDLPERVTVLPGQAGSGDEGTAMLEIAHDLAPGAELYFAEGFYSGGAQFAANIEALCEAGADVIVDDIKYFDEPAFQDGIIAQGGERGGRQRLLSLLGGRQRRQPHQRHVRGLGGGLCRGLRSPGRRRRPARPLSRFWRRGGGERDHGDWLESNPAVVRPMGEVGKRLRPLPDRRGRQRGNEFQRHSGRLPGSDRVH